MFASQKAVFTSLKDSLSTASLKGLFAKANQGVGIEITPKQVNIVQLRKQKQVCKLGAFSSIPVPEGLFAEGRITDTMTMAELIRSGLEAKKINVKQVVSSIPIREAVIRLIQLPAELDDFELQEIVLNQEAALYLPFPREEADVDFQKLGTSMNEDGIEQVEVLLVATPTAVTESYLETFQQAGLNLHVLEVSSFALLRVIREQLLQFISPEAVAISDIEFDSTEISIVMDGVPQFTRTVPIGTYQIQSILSRAMNLPLGMGADLLKSATVPLTPSDEAGGKSPGSIALLGILGELAEELRRSIDFYLNQGNNLEVSQLLLAGPGGGIEQLDQFFSHRLSLPTQQIDPIAALSLEMPEEVSPSECPGFSVVMGLGLREA